jgi:ADP-ribosyl-[dinitrogen reductase] hydrolase
MTVHRKKDRAMGAFIGLAVGDALGTTVEFQARDSFPPVTDMVGGGVFKLKPGQWTDDTSMALCLADTLIAGKGQLDKKVLLEKFLRWWKFGENSCTGECFDIGNTTRKALAWYDRTGMLENNPEEGASGNGSLMRLAPVAVCGKDRWITARLATQQSMTTHASQIAVSVCGQTAWLLADLIDGRKIKPEDWGEQYGIVSWDSLFNATRSEIESSGYVVDTFRAALWSVIKTSSFRDAVLLAVNLGDDADTVGAVTGQIAGALYGLNAIPVDWRRKLAWTQKLHEKAEQLWALRGEKDEDRTF